MSTPALNPLVEKIRSTYPGQYDDMDDATLTKAVLAKYPQYSDLAAPKVGVHLQAPPTPPSTVGAIANRLISGPEGTPKSPSKVPQSIQNASPALGEAISGITGLGAAALAPAAIPAVNSRALPFLYQAGKRTVQAAPSVAAMEGIRRARSIPFLGKFIPPGAEILPFLMGGKEKGAAAEEEAGAEAGSTDQVPGRPYQPNPRYQAPPEPEPLPPRNGPLLLRGNVDQPPAPPPVTRAQVGRAVNESLDVTPPTPGEPIYNRLPFAPKPEPAGETIPAGHTATPGSSALSSYHYDPASGEFTAIFKGGQTGHVYGGISPEQVQYLEQSSSKGKAFQAIKNSGVPVAKIVNGKRIELPRQVPTGDLTNILTRSLRQVQGNQ